MTASYWSARALEHLNLIATVKGDHPASGSRLSARPHGPFPDHVMGSKGPRPFAAGGCILFSPGAPAPHPGQDHRPWTPSFQQTYGS